MKKRVAEMQQPVQAAGDLGGHELLQQLHGSHELHSLGDSDRQMGLAHSRPVHQYDVLRFGQKAQFRQLLDPGRRQGRLEGEVELLQGATMGKRALAMWALMERSVLAAISSSARRARKAV